MKQALLVIFLFTVAAASAQTIQIAGTLKTTTGGAVPYASITLKNSLQHIITYTTSDVNGLFKLSIHDTINIQGKTIEINHLGYKKVSIALRSGQTLYNITLEDKKIDLAEVEIKSPPKIRSKNDTLSYDVGSFTKSEDRSIGDVLKRMPGIEVEESGQIKYNGKNISNLYIDGDDLLNDRYNVGTKTIPHEMVKDIEVLQNHQPIEVMRNKSISDDVAINLKIKEEAKLKMSGQAKIGGGTPNLYDLELNSILFNKKHKMLNVAKANNIGVDLSTDFTAFNVRNMLQAMDNRRPTELLSSGTASAPGLPKERYYFNQSASLNANNLTNLKNGFQLKSNIGLFIDNNHLDYNSWNEVYLNNDTIRYSESQDISKKPYLANISLNLKANKKTYYFNNTLKVDLSGQKDASSLNSNNLNIGQLLLTNTYDFSNTLNYIPELKNKNILSVNWYINHYNQPQSLAITPGINENTLNDSIPFQGINQSTEVPTWFNNVSFGYGLPKGLIKQNYLIGLISEWQHLKSDLLLTQANGEQTSFAKSQNNDLHWNRHRFYINPSYEYERGPWESILSIPLAFQGISYSDENFTLHEQHKRFLFNPNWMLKYSVNSEDYIATNYSYSNQIGNINDIYRGAILTNYRNLQTNRTTLQEKDTHNLDVRYNFQRSISMLFMNVGVNYSIVSANTINSLEITNNLSQTVQLPFANSTNTFSVNGGISKYIFALDLNVGLRSSWSNTRYNQFLNDQLLPFNNISFVFNPYFETRIFNQISLKYEGKGTWTTSKLISDKLNNSFPNRQINVLDQSLGFSYAPTKDIFMKISGRQLITKQKNTEKIDYFFTDLSIRYRIDKWKADLQLDANNLANIKSYEMYSLSANEFAYSHYQLRGRTFLIKMTIPL